MAKSTVKTKSKKTKAKGASTGAKAPAKTKTPKPPKAPKVAKVKVPKVPKVKVAKTKEPKKPSLLLTKRVPGKKPKGVRGLFSKVRGGATETNLIRRLTAKTIPSKIQSFKAGDTVNVYVKVKEGEKERVQLFKGLVTKLQGSGAMRCFTVRKISSGVGVERTFPFQSPALERVELVATGKVRRAKLYYLRSLDGKAAKIESELAIPKSAEARAMAEAEAQDQVETEEKT